MSSKSQTAASTEISSRQVIERAVELYDNKKYDESIAELKKVHRNDSNYYLASVEMILSYLSTSRDSAGLALCDNLLKIKNEYTPNILVYKADFLDNLHRSDEAEKVYKQGMKDYPLNHSFYYEIGVTKVKQQKYSEAYDCFVKTLKINPFHAASHFQLGLMARRNNSLVSSLLAYQFYLICDQTSQRAKSLVGSMEKMAKMESEPDTILSLKEFETNNDYSELESILKSKVALSEKYKSKVDLNYDLIKQMQLLVENIGKYKNVKGFYNDFYGKFFTELQNQKLFEPFVYSSLSGLEIENVNRWIAKNKSEVDKYEKWAYNYICINMATYPENLNGQTTEVPHWFSNNKILGAGLINNGNREGYWNFYYNNGIKRSEGEFKKGVKTGPWKYYFAAGNIKEYHEMNNGEEKVYKTYYENNNPKVDLAFTDNKINGEVKTYYSNGNINMIRNYKDGKIAGKETQYFRNSSLKYIVENNEGIYNGDFLEYYDNGNVYQKFTFVNGAIVGKASTYYNNDNNSLESEGAYVKNKITGEWKYYHKNGKLWKQGSFNDSGERDGLWKEFYEDGKPNSEENYSDGKLNGPQKYFDTDGNLWQEYVYKKNKMLEYRGYKKDGSKICDNKTNGKNYEVVFYYSNSQKRREGKISDGDLEGVWKDYSVFGVLTQESTYKEGNLNGPLKEYYQTGKVKRDRNFTNGVENGNYTAYYINGNVEREGKIVNGKNEGYWKYYYINGTLRHIYYYVASDLEGWTENFDVNGKINREDLYKEGCVVKVVYYDTLGQVSQNVDLPGGNGIIEKKTPLGKISFHKEFVKDYPDNTETTFYPDGIVESKVTYKKGKKEGKHLLYDEMGRLVSETPYFNDEVDGKKIVYNEDGKIRSDHSFDNGDYHGPSLSFHDNGKQERVLTYKNGNAEGPSEMFDETGELIYRRVFFNDFLVNYTYKDATGNFVKPLELAPGLSKVLCYFQNGKKSIETTYSNGDLHGKRIIYSSTGKVSADQDFYYEKEHGISKVYFANGTLKASEIFYYGSLHGKSQSYYENGVLKAEKNFKLGQKHGWFKFYDDKGKLVKSVFYYNDEPLLIS
ncbi:MAG: hypothetical protein H0W61_05295 [Bacteroidetes bacterium]|nr:hypothetical protein [Bacteroidota bacterium]